MCSGVVLTRVLLVCSVCGDGGLIGFCFGRGTFGVMISRSDVSSGSANVLYIVRQSRLPVCISVGSYGLSEIYPWATG